jgi:hypothetical protein
VLLEVKDPDGSSVIINVHTITTIVAGPKPRKSR